MKTNSTTISFLFFSKTYGISFFKQIPIIFSVFFSNHKTIISYCLACLAIGAILLGLIIVFLIQLAEYGW